MSIPARCFFVREGFADVAMTTCSRARVSEALGVKVERPQRREDERP